MPRRTYLQGLADAAELARNAAATARAVKKGAYELEAQGADSAARLIEARIAQEGDATPTETVAVCSCGLAFRVG